MGTGRRELGVAPNERRMLVDVVQSSLTKRGFLRSLILFGPWDPVVQSRDGQAKHGCDKPLLAVSVSSKSTVRHLYSWTIFTAQQLLKTSQLWTTTSATLFPTISPNHLASSMLNALTLPIPLLQNPVPPTVSPATVGSPARPAAAWTAKFTASKVFGSRSSELRAAGARGAHRRRREPASGACPDRAVLGSGTVGKTRRHRGARCPGGRDQLGARWSWRVGSCWRRCEVMSGFLREEVSQLVWKGGGPM